MQPLNIPASIEFIGDSAFNMSGVVDGDFPEGLTYLGEKAFFNCTGLTTISLPSTVETYGPNIFYGCKNVTYVELPQDMEKIPSGLLWNCTGLKRIYIPSSVKEIGNAAFYGSGLEKLNLPDGLEEDRPVGLLLHETQGDHHSGLRRDHRLQRLYLLRGRSELLCRLRRKVHRQGCLLFLEQQV